ncbi:50S ribosomal protein L34e [Metallosphaera tengchongensis]|uniref:50S ribosomal protein L34e n=1 Tax=Metallosphaera tengchongensis TaxID=1532350 RepID=A0A6N0NUW1_9CREN|nr:50S ribosomal protein L34e [Metallosphaera tengchongensis]QKQ99946.1 50S ribosomal protein L34e [Metallosphaera tengchongensis]
MRPFQRTSSLRKISRRTPSGKSKTLLKSRRRNSKTCASCKKLLRGNLRSENRMFGGYLCHRCLSKYIKVSLRGIS